MCRVSQNVIDTPYMTVYMVISLQKIPYAHRIYMVMANPSHEQYTYLHMSNIRNCNTASYLHMSNIRAYLRMSNIRTCTWALYVTATLHPSQEQDTYLLMSNILNSIACSIPAYEQDKITCIWAVYITPTLHPPFLPPSTATPDTAIADWLFYLPGMLTLVIEWCMNSLSVRSCTSCIYRPRQP
jgi:hypothetical protein